MLSNLFTDKAVVEFDACLAELASANETQRQDVRRRCIDLLRKKDSKAIVRSRSKEACDFLIDVIGHCPDRQIIKDALVTLADVAGEPASQSLVSFIKKTHDMELAETAIDLIYRLQYAAFRDSSRYPKAAMRNGYWRATQIIGFALLFKRPEAEKQSLADYELKAWPDPVPPMGSGMPCPECYTQTYGLVDRNTEILPTPPGTNWLPLPVHHATYRCSTCGYTYRATE